MHEAIIQVLLLVVGGLLCILQTAAILLFKFQGNKLERFCEANEKAHDELWRHFNHHKHTEYGEVVITRGVDV